MLKTAKFADANYAYYAQSVYNQNVNMVGQDNIYFKVIGDPAILDNDKRD